jgi:hypothetical protein
VRCLHCGEEYEAKEMKYENRFGSETPIWWCAKKDCDGAGFGYDIFPKDHPMVKDDEPPEPWE